MLKETHFQSITVIPDGIPLGDMLQKEIFAGSVVGIHFICDGSFSPEYLADYAKSIALTRFDPDKITIAESYIDDKDRFFAREFGYKVAPRFAYLELSGNDIEAWIGSVLLSDGHPLAGIDVANAAVLFTDSSGFKGGLQVRELQLYDATVSSYYVRLTAQDRPSALSEICTIFGDSQISMQGILQPQVAEDSSVADIGILFHPTVTATLYLALGQVQATSACKSVDTVLKAID